MVGFHLVAQILDHDQSLTFIRSTRVCVTHIDIML